MNAKQSRAITAKPPRAGIGNARLFGICSLMVLLLVATAKTQAAQGPPPRLSPPEQVTMTTRDGVSIAGTYYPSYMGTKAVPILILHGWKGNRNRFDGFAHICRYRQTLRRRNTVYAPGRICR